WGIPRNTL
ncbi:NAD-dependent DNA ligase adenylation domain protein, partial [Chlamydia psittaci 84-8471/1]